MYIKKDNQAYSIIIKKYLEKKQNNTYIQNQ